MSEVRVESRPASKDWTLSRLLTHFREEGARLQMRHGRLIILWPEKKGPFSIDLRHAIDVYTPLLEAMASHKPIVCNEPDCEVDADVVLFPAYPVCKTHAEVTATVKTKTERAA